MKHFFSTLLAGLALLAASRPQAAQAQAPRLMTTSPAPFAPTPRAAPVQATFSEPVTGAAGIRLFTSQVGGWRAGTASGDGTATLSFQPWQVLAPGERVQVSIPATVRAVGAGGAPLAGGQVREFWAAAGPATGRFTTGPLIAQGHLGVDDLTLADLNNDGNLDLLHTDGSAPGTGTSVLKLRLGDGQGGFGAGQAVGPAEGLTVADVNADGNLDIITVGLVGASSGLRVSYGDGLGGFPTSYTLPLTAQALAPRVGDLNGDGLPDLLLVRYAAAPTPTGGPAQTELLVRLNDGQGGFTALPNLLLPFEAVRDLFLRDLNNDGRLDILFYGATGGLRHTYLGDGSGGFGAAGGVPVASAPVEELADLTGDGLLDIVTVFTSSNGAWGYKIRTLSVYAGLAAGGFDTTATSTSQSLALAQARNAARAVDVDGDGDLDLLVSEIGPAPNDAPVGMTHTLLNDGQGNFTRAPGGTYGVGGLATVGDVNNDGAMDAVVLSGEFALLSGFHVLRNAPLPTAPTIGSFTPGSGPAGTVVTLTGTNLLGATAVLVGGVPVTGFTVVSGTSITFNLPAGLNSGLVTVVTPTGQATTGRLTVTLATRPAGLLAGTALYPNPAHGTATLLLPAMPGAVQAEIALYDPLGQLVREFPAVALPAGGLRTELNLTPIAAGLYTVRVRAARYTYALKLAVE